MSSAASEARRDRWTCPWRTTGWWVLAAAIGAAAAAAVVAAIIVALVVGRTAGIITGVVGLGAVGVLGAVAGAVVAEDRAGVQPAGLQRAWRRAVAALRRLRHVAGRFPVGPLRSAVDREVQALSEQLDLERLQLQAWWEDHRATVRLERTAHTGGATTTATAAPLVAARRTDVEQRATLHERRLDDLAGATERLVAALEDRRALDRLTSSLPSGPAAPSAEVDTAGSPPDVDALTAALHELAELDRQTVERVVDGAPDQR
jgi:hypothetical protein